MLLYRSIYDLADLPSQHVAQVPNSDLYCICKDLEWGREETDYTSSPTTPTQLPCKKSP